MLVQPWLANSTSQICACDLFGVQREVYLLNRQSNRSWARFFAPRLFEAFRKSKRYLRPPIIEDLRGCEDLKPGHLHAACLKEAR
jgi:hypothetical protein